VLRYIQLNVVECDLYPFTAKCKEYVEADGRRRIELWISRREKPAWLRRRAAVKVERALGVPAWTAACHFVLTCISNQLINQFLILNVLSDGKVTRLQEVKSKYIVTSIESKINRRQLSRNF